MRNGNVELFPKSNNLLSTGLCAERISADHALGQMEVRHARDGASSEQSETLPRVWFDFDLALDASAYSLHFLLSKHRRTAFDPAPLARGGRKPRQPIQELVGYC